ncbi:MAG: glycoside hydrolase family 3 C-terminal domain-containing protein [Bacteroidia bacterium]|nr:glycoside hydrolase family 3 C-terminal domain-containing protein [Bacteroidia bacterium]
MRNRLTKFTIILFLLPCAATLAQGTYPSQPVIEGRAVNVMVVNQLRFKDLNKNNSLDRYEDWRLPVDQRIDDLVKQMSLQEKVGMMLINTLNADPGGKLPVKAVDFIEDEKMTRFIFRNVVTQNPRQTTGGGFAGVQITPFEAAQFMNAIQELAENTRLGIPPMFKSNSRNHVEFDARVGINEESGAFSSWPKESGLAATRDMNLIGEFARTMRQEWTSIGLRGMYGYMGDLSTEPRWYRVHETFSEDAQLTADIITTLIKNLQGLSLSSTSVAMTIKHFPGGGPQEGGGDPHYAFGKNQVYPALRFDYHLIPFQAAIKAGASSIMAYYGIPVGQAYLPNTVGMAFSKGIVTDLLQKKLGFKGYVNSDTGIIGDRAWGLEDKSIDEQILIAIDAGTDILSGFNDNKQLLNLVTSGKLAASRVDASVKRLLKEQFELGLFENPYVDPNRASYTLGNASNQRKADLAQRKSIVLLQNKMSLPLVVPKEGDTLHVFTMGMNANAFKGQAWSRVKVVSGNYDAKKSEKMPAIRKDTDYAVIRIYVTNDASANGLRFGGASPDELNFLSFSSMATSKSWKVTPSLQDIQQIMKTVGPEKTILSIDFRQPYVLDENSGLLNAGAILATFGVSDAAILDIVSGKFNPTGKLPYALANKEKAVIDQHPDAPGYPAEDTLFPFGYGLTF